MRDRCWLLSGGLMRLTPGCVGGVRPDFLVVGPTMHALVAAGRQFGASLDRRCSHCQVHSVLSSNPTIAQARVCKRPRLP